jgi:general secretion pathway protein E
VQSFLDILLSRSLVTPEQAARLERAAGQSGESLVRQIYRLGYVDQQVLASELARHFSLRPVDEEDWPTGPILPESISQRFMREHMVVPLAADHANLKLAVADPTDQSVFSALGVATERRLDLRIASEAQIVSHLERLQEGEQASARTAPPMPGSEEDEEHLKDLALDAPVIDLVNRLFREASAARATDLHIEPSKGRVMVRRRIDGLLQEAQTLPPDFGRAAVSRIKILTQLNIAERRLPQDGRARLRIGERDYDIRVATMPTIHGESIAIRFLSSANQVPDIGMLGLTAADLDTLKQQASHSYGMIVVTGPTGSGKTTTLAAVLDFLNDPASKLLSIEDPVEYQVEGVNQIQVRPDIGLTFATALRSILRLDPDIIMVGEMRDSETAKISINAALTGHLVLTTLHTNSAAGAITRLMDLDVQAYLIASTLRLVVAQRLVRKLCPNCRQRYVAPPELIEELPADLIAAAAKPLRLWKPVGCDQCNGTGYLGRAAIFEMLVIDEDMRHLIKPGVSADIIAAQAQRAGMKTMLADGFVKALDGLTAIEELGRVTSED